MNPDDIDKLASLGGLRLGDEEREVLAEELGDLVGYIERLEDADTASVEPVTHPVPDGGGNQTERDDTVRDGLERDELMANAPATADGEFEVPDVSGEEGS